MSTGSTGSTFPKWQLAVLLGAPVALTLGYLYYKRQSSIEEESSSDDKKKKLDLRNKTVSIDADDDKSLSNNKQKNSPSTKQLTPLEQVTQLKNKGNEMFKLGKFDEAINFYDEAIQDCPKSNPIDLSTFYQNRAAAYEQLQNWSAVRDDCTKALELNPKYVKAYHRRAKAFEQMKDLPSSLEDITATCILEKFQNHSTLLFADRVLKSLGAEHATEAMTRREPIAPSKHFVKAFFSSFTQDPLRKIVVASSEPKGFIRAKLALENNEFDVVIPACTEEIDSSEVESEYKMEATLLRGTMYELTGQFTEALADFQTIINNKDASVKLRVNALIKRASIHVQMDDLDKCFTDFSAAEELDDTNPDIFYHRGQMYVLLQRLTDSVNDFSKTISLAPDFSIAYVQKLYAEYRSAIMEQDHIKLFQLMQNFKDAIEKYPNCVECYSILAQILTEQGQFQEADSFFEKALQIDSGNATLYVHRGLLWLQWRGEVNSVIDLLNRAIDVDERCEFAYETLASIEVQRGYMDRAIELFDKAISLAKSETELRHLFSLKDAAIAQINVSKKMGIDVASLAALAASSM